MVSAMSVRLNDRASHSRYFSDELDELDELDI